MARAATAYEKDFIQDELAVCCNATGEGGIKSEFVVLEGVEDVQHPDDIYLDQLIKDQGDDKSI